MLKFAQISCFKFILSISSFKEKFTLHKSFQSHSQKNWTSTVFEFTLNIRFYTLPDLQLAESTALLVSLMREKKVASIFTEFCLCISVFFFLFYFFFGSTFSCAQLKSIRLLSLCAVVDGEWVREREKEKTSGSLWVGNFEFCISSTQ